MQPIRKNSKTVERTPYRRYIFLGTLPFLGIDTVLGRMDAVTPLFRLSMHKFAVSIPEASAKVLNYMSLHLSPFRHHIVRLSACRYHLTSNRETTILIRHVTSFSTCAESAELCIWYAVDGLPVTDVLRRTDDDEECGRCRMYRT